MLAEPDKLVGHSVNRLIGVWQQESGKGRQRVDGAALLHARPCSIPYPPKEHLACLILHRPKIPVVFPTYGLSATVTGKMGPDMATQSTGHELICCPAGLVMTGGYPGCTRGWGFDVRSFFCVLRSSSVMSESK